MTDFVHDNTPARPFAGNHFTSGGSDLVSEGSSVSGRFVFVLDSLFVSLFVFLLSLLSG